MKAILTRNTDDGVQTLGTLQVFSDADELEFSCLTIERPYLNNQHIISCIPAGDYQCAWGFMQDKQVHHYEILNVPDRSGIFLHKANLVSQLEGCVALVKSYVVNNGVTTGVDSGVAVDAFETLMNQQPFELSIIAPPQSV